MEIEELVSSQSLDIIVNDKKKYRKMMLILEQTLIDLGYSQSAKILQQQSNIKYYSQSLKLIEKHLNENNFIGAIQVITELRNSESLQPSLCKLQLETKTLNLLKNMIYQVFCLQKILHKQNQQAIRIINEYFEDQQQKERLCEALVLGESYVSEKEIEKRKKQEILKFCIYEYQQINERQIQKVIQSYTQNQGEQNNQLKNFLLPNKKLPPMKILCNEAKEHIKGLITHLKINPIHDFLVVVTEHQINQQLNLFKINRKNLEYQRQISQSGHLSLKLKYPIFNLQNTKTLQFKFRNKKQPIQSICWNQSKENPLLAVSSLSIIQLLNINLQVIKKIQATNNIQKIIYLAFHPLSDLLYVSGYFEYMSVYDGTGQAISSIYPYPKTRKFLFYKNYVIGISLVSNLIYKHCIDQQTQIGSNQLDQKVNPMDICICERNKMIGVSSQQFIYLINVQSLEIIGKTMSPSSPNKLMMIEIGFYNNFLITLCKNFVAFQIGKDDNKIELGNNNNISINKFKQWSGQGTFSISLKDNIMISGYKQLICWQQGSLTDILQDDQQFEIQIENENSEYEYIQDTEMIQEDDEDEDNDSDEDIDDDISQDQFDEEMQI